MNRTGLNLGINAVALENSDDLFWDELYSPPQLILPWRDESLTQCSQTKTAEIKDDPAKIQEDPGPVRSHLIPLISDP